MSRQQGVVYTQAFKTLAVACVVVAATRSGLASDWPQWRHDAGRTAASPEKLPDQLYLQWTRCLSHPQPAWPKYPRLCFDASYEPVVMAGTMFVPSMVTDSLIALEADTGVERWRFYADGPVRLAPVASGGKVYFVSDDGHLYCLDAASGRLLWKFRGLPPERNDRKVLGNDRLISLWPARGGPVLVEGRIYFAAGIWPFEGVYIYALDAETGNVVWSNKDTGFIEHARLDHGMQPDARPEGGLSPQGYLALIGDRLFVPGGRAMPAILDPNSGKLEPYCSSWGGRINMEKGSWYVSGTGKYLSQSGDLYDLASGIRLTIDPANRKELGDFRQMVLTADAIYYSLPSNEMRGYRPVGVGYDRIVAWDMTKPPKLSDWQAEKGHEWMNGWAKNPVYTWRAYKWKVASFQELWSLASRLKVHIKAGSRLYAGATGTVAAIDIPGPGGRPKVSWKADIEGTPSTMLTADGKLFVVTREGRIYAFGANRCEPKTYAVADGKPANTTDKWSQVARDMLNATGAKHGHCLVLGVGSGRLAAELASQSKLHVIALDPDAAKVQKLRRRFDEAGLYGRQVVVHQGDPLSYPLPPYIASLIVSEDPAAAGLASGEKFVRQVFRLLHPYGGAARVALPADQQDAFAGWVKAAGLTGVEVGRAGDFAVLRRVGALPDSADWTHENADAGSSLVSSDKLAKPPFGVLWFGGAVDMVFPQWDYTHFAAPTPLVAGGRMFFQVWPKLHAVDIYTGRHLWAATLPGMQASPRRSRLKYVAAEDSVYVVSGKTCFRIDAASGSTLSEFSSPAEHPAWREVRIWGDCLIATAGKVLVCMDRKSGQTKWTYKAERQPVDFVVGSGKVFCADVSLPDRKGQVTTPEGRLVALDATNGNQRWQAAIKLDRSKGPLRPLRLSYSEANDILVAVYGRVTAYRGKDGGVLWGDKVIQGADQPILHPDRLITQFGQMYDLRTGTQLKGRLWGGKPNHVTRGCNRAIGAQYMVLIRDAHASYFDLSTCRQTYFRGVRSGCTNSLIPAGGLLNAPNFAHGCSCNYPVFTSLALIPMAELGK